jgi:hypothetical protein
MELVGVEAKKIPLAHHKEINMTEGQAEVVETATEDITSTMEVDIIIIMVDKAVVVVTTDIMEAEILTEMIAEAATWASKGEEDQALGTRWRGQEADPEAVVAWAVTVETWETVSFREAVVTSNSSMAAAVAVAVTTLAEEEAEESPMGKCSSRTIHRWEAEVAAVLVVTEKTPEEEGGDLAAVDHHLSHEVLIRIYKSILIQLIIF